ncbi:MAG: hypothetical protein ABIC04_01640 [Nanoarchaeota archaeon]
MDEKITSKTSKPNILQTILLVIIYGGIIISIVFSIAAARNIGQVGYDKCIEKACQVSKEHCEKFRTQNNCCTGAGGNMNIAGNNYICVFS